MSERKLVQLPLQVFNMLAKKFQRIRDMTKQIAEFVEAFNVEGCTLLLQQRLILLEEVQNEVTSAEGSLYQQEFEQLLVWLEQEDVVPQQKTLDYKKKSQDNLSKQKKTNFAIKQYTSL